MAAHPGDQAYGAVSVKIDYWAVAKVVGRVPPTVFVPRPRSTRPWSASSAARDPQSTPAVTPYRRLAVVVRAGFAQRRKMLRGSLAGVVSPRGVRGRRRRPSGPGRRSWASTSGGSWRRGRHPEERARRGG